MRLIPISKDSMALTGVVIVGTTLFIGGLCNVLDYLIIKAILFMTFGFIFILAVSCAVKNDKKKNRPEDQLQDDSH